MAGTFVAALTVSQSATGNIVTVTDNSNYVASGEGISTFSNRVVTATKADGTTVTVPVFFPIVNGSGDSVSFTIDRDYALSINLTLTSKAPVSGSVYAKTGLYPFVSFTQYFIFGLMQNISADPNSLNDGIYQKSLQKLFNELSNAQLAGGTYNDQVNAQNALDRAYNLILNSQINF